SLKTSIKTITYLSDIGCLEIQGASLSATPPGFTGKVEPGQRVILQNPVSVFLLPDFCGRKIAFFLIE
ncbi:hypothetical protein NP053_16875, partial [Salmonella enterica]|nr:hypothetical protein [Salmonella enterica]